MNKPQLKADAVPLDIRVRNGEVAWWHIESEYVDIVDEIIDTLAPNEPYAYTVNCAPTEDGSIPFQQIMYTRDQIRSAYQDMHRVSTVRDMQAIAEIRTDWYVYCYGLGEGLVKATGDIVHVPTSVLFPTMGQLGITGEMFWMRSGRGPAFTAGREGALAAETAILDRHETYVKHLQDADVDSIVGMYHPGAQVVVRDYVGDTGTVIDLHSDAELRAYLETFFARYRVHEISLINRYACDWMVFAELMWVVEEISAPGKLLKFYTAEHSEVWPDGRFASRIGHGTDAAPV